MNDIEFNIRSVKVSISFWFVLFIAVASCCSYNFHVVMISVIIHELSHVLFLYKNGGKIKGISLKLTDINISSDVMLLPPFKAIEVLLAGPLVNILAGIIFYKLNESIGITNFIIGFFQLLPVASSDLDNLITVISKGRYYKILKIIYFFFALFIFILGINLIIVSRWNYTLLIMGIFLIIRTVL